VVSFWDYAAFVVNSLIFLLMGMLEAHQNFTEVLLADRHRHCSGHCGAGPVHLSLLQPVPGFSAEVKTSHQHVLFWGGLRGALALALSLGLPTTLPYRDAVVTVAFAVVAYSSDRAGTLDHAADARPRRESDRPAPTTLERPLLRPAAEA